MEKITVTKKDIMCLLKLYKKVIFEVDDSEEDELAESMIDDFINTKKDFTLKMKSGCTEVVFAVVGYKANSNLSLTKFTLILVNEYSQAEKYIEQTKEKCNYYSIEKRYYYRGKEGELVL